MRIVAVYEVFLADLLPHSDGSIEAKLLPAYHPPAHLQRSLVFYSKHGYEFVHYFGQRVSLEF